VQPFYQKPSSVHPRIRIALATILVVFYAYGELWVFIHDERGKMGDLKGRHADEVIGLSGERRGSAVFDRGHFVQLRGP